MEERDDYPIIPQPSKDKDRAINNNKEFLNWIYERMICVHGERDLYDYMINFKSIIDSQQDQEELKKELASLKEENAKLKAIEEKMSPGLLQFIADMFDNLNRVSQMQRPFMWNVALVCTGDNKVLDNLVNVWAGVGEANPIKRIEQLLNQRDILRQFIVKLNESHTLTDEEKANLTLLMKCTDPS